MHNKELLMTGITIPRKEPHTLITIVLYVNNSDFPYTTVTYGYSDYKDEGNVSRIPCWGGYGTIKNYTALETLATEAPTDGKTVIKWRNPFSPNRLVVTRLDTGKSVEFVHTDSSASKLFADASLFTESDEGREIPVIFDPPPRLLFGSRYRRTDLGRGYYVEEVPWEAQNAEQGSSDDGWCRGVVDYAILSYRRHLCTDNASTSRREHCLGRESRPHYYDVACATAECTKTYVGRWSCGDHTTQRHSCRTRWHTRNSLPHSTRQYISRGTLRSLTSKEALYA